MAHKFKSVENPLVIVTRGDCTSRRAIALNPELFDQQPVFRQSQKSTFGQFLDSLAGLSISEEFLNSISDVAEMPRTLASYYLGQANRDALNCQDADLLMLDSYADMNFSLWRSKLGGPRFWIHPKFLKDRAAFVASYEELGRATLEQSVADAASLISKFREFAPELPVLFLNQQVDYYPKLAERVKDYYQLGALVASQVSDVFFGGVIDKDALELADIGSCGPGNTLHFQGSTYKSMLDTALSRGLGEAIERRNAAKAHPVEAVIQAVAETPATTSGELRSAPCKFAELVIIEIVEPNLMFDPHNCGATCKGFMDSLPKVFENYFYLEHNKGQDEPPRFTPMMIDLEPIDDFNSWIYSRPATYRHQFQKSERAGFDFEPYNVKNHVPDIFEINNSKEVRSGGAIRSNLTKSIEEMGGAPTALASVAKLMCPKHWRQSFGVFVPVEGYMQGELELGKKLIAYISVVRYGEFALFAQIMGHGGYLAEGVVNFVAQKVVEQALTAPWGKASGLRYLMYGGAQN
ncbi:MAG: hypothetical protein EBY26_06365, partial [Microbacteriaceae bacterium]|nr:hypothetical protein [Microbacteriaceae bacterium]